MFTINLIENVTFDQHVVADERAYQSDVAILVNEIKTLSTMTELSQLPCQVQHMSSVAIKSQSREWWRDHACQINANGRQIGYVVEQITNDNCISYYRLTLNCEQSTVLIQGNVAMILPLQQGCMNKPHKVSTGLLNHYFL